MWDTKATTSCPYDEKDTRLKILAPDRKLYRHKESRHPDCYFQAWTKVLGKLSCLLIFLVPMVFVFSCFSFFFFLTFFVTVTTKCTPSPCVYSKHVSQNWSPQRDNTVCIRQITNKNFYSAKHMDLEISSWELKDWRRTQSSSQRAFPCHSGFWFVYQRSDQYIWISVKLLSDNA